MCMSLRTDEHLDGRLHLALDGAYALQTCSAGGWLLVSDDVTFPAYWAPRWPSNRTTDRDGHILTDAQADLTSVTVGTHQLGVEFELGRGGFFDLVVWRFESRVHQLLDELRHLSAIEEQPAFLWSSHTRYTRPADVYDHLVFGHVYENHTIWPRHWRVCSELDAQSLYVILSGLNGLTGKSLYRLLKDQLVLSLIDRQCQDGGWYHGEWTELMESHYRLHCAGIQLLAAALQEGEDERIRSALEMAADFVSRRAQRIDAGVWFMHDSLEADEESIKRYPFRWASSRAFGKRRTNMLILNTHLDTIIALDRYREATGDERYVPQVASACEAAEAVLGERPAEALYRVLSWVINLTLLPKREAARLPLAVRVLKRIGWKYLAPNLHRIKAIWPRIIMPNGFIERSLTQAGFTSRYQSVHLWDLARFLRRFHSDVASAVLCRALAYTQDGSRIREHWKEDPARWDALGFWQEALYGLYVSASDPKLIGWLAQAVIDSDDVGVGVAPSLLGGNQESVGRNGSAHLALCGSRELRFVNLSSARGAEILLVNPGRQVIDIEPSAGWSFVRSWRASSQLEGKPALAVPARGWLWGRGDG